MALAFYISHPQVVMDPAVPVPRWGLSDLGRQRLLGLRDERWVQTFTAIHASDETKAVETAHALSAIANCPVFTDARFGENDRSSTGFLPPAEFEIMRIAFFGSPYVSVRGWEPAIAAQARVVQAVDRVLASQDPEKPIAFSGHGAVGTLLFCHLAGEPIDVRHDQPHGGGNVYAFDMERRRPLCAWTPIEHAADMLARLPPSRA